MRCGHRPVRAADFLLVAVVEVGEVEGLVFRTGFHFLQGIAQIRVAEFVEAYGLGIVGGDRHDRDPLVLVIGHELFDPILVGLGGRAVIAGKNHGEDLCRRKIR